MDSIHEPTNHLAPVLVDTLQRLGLAYDRNRSLEADVEVYRMGWQQAIHVLHEVIKERDRLRATNRRLHEERRQVKGALNVDHKAA